MSALTTIPAMLNPQLNESVQFCKIITPQNEEREHSDSTSFPQLFSNIRGPQRKRLSFHSKKEVETENET